MEQSLSLYLHLNSPDVSQPKNTNESQITIAEPRRKIQHCRRTRGVCVVEFVVAVILDATGTFV